MDITWHNHANLEGTHAILAPSKPSWLRYDDDTVAHFMARRNAAEEGVKLHAIASTLIEEGIQLKNTRQTLNRFVNDAIFYHMESEMVLAPSQTPSCYGTADAISYREERIQLDDNRKIKMPVLRVFDLKTGTTKPHEEQIIVYMALFCMEYGIDPLKTFFVGRFYQNDEVYEFLPTGAKVRETIACIVHQDECVRKFLMYNAQ